MYFFCIDCSLEMQLHLPEFTCIVRDWRTKQPETRVRIAWHNALCCADHKPLAAVRCLPYTSIPCLVTWSSPAYEHASVRIDFRAGAARRSYLTRCRVALSRCAPFSVPSVVVRPLIDARGWRGLHPGKRRTVHSPYCCCTRTSLASCTVRTSQVKLKYLNIVNLNLH